MMICLFRNRVVKYLSLGGSNGRWKKSWKNNLQEGF